MKKIILLAAVLYFLIAPFTYHPDTKLTLRYPALENGKVWDIYGYINSHKLDIPDFHYPPAHYWWLKIHYPISKFFGGRDFDQWLTSSSSEAVFDRNILKYDLAAKLPLLILGLMSGFLIYKLINKYSGDENKARIGAIIWYFNPITLYSLVLMGQNDVVGIFLFLLGIYFYDKWLLMSLFWGLAAGVKSYPVIWAIMFLLIFEKKFLKLFLKSVSFFTIYGLILLPWFGKNYFYDAVLNSGLSQRMFIANISIGFEKNVLVIPLLLTIIAISAWKNKHHEKLAIAVLVIIQSCLVILGFSHFNPQWMVWIMPFVSIFWAIKGIDKTDVLLAVMVLLTWIVLTLGFDDIYLTWGLVTPINQNLINYPSLIEFLRNRNIEVSGLVNICQSVLAAVSIWLLSYKFKAKVFKGKQIKLLRVLIYIPFMLVALFVFLFVNLKGNQKYSASSSIREVGINELLEKEWSYRLPSGSKYLEIMLNNIGLFSKDEMTLEISTDNNKIVNNIGSFNTQASNWFRINLPVELSNANEIKLSVKDIRVKDGLLKIGFNEDNKVAINFYSLEKPSLTNFFGKLSVCWWVWMAIIGLSVLYFL